MSTSTSLELVACGIAADLGLGGRCAGRLRGAGELPKGEQAEDEEVKRRVAFGWGPGRTGSAALALGTAGMGRQGIACA